MPILNKPENLTPQNFISINDAGNGPSRVSRFAVRIQTPPAMANQANIVKDLTYLCETAEIPGRGFLNTDLKYYGPSFKVPFQTTYEDVSFSFMVRNWFLERQFFDIWFQTINPINTYNFRYRKEYVGRVDIFQMTDFSLSGTNDPEAAYLASLDEAYPIAMTGQQLVSGDENFHKLNVTFTYKRWFNDPVQLKTPFEKFDLVDNAHVISITAPGSTGSIISMFRL